MNRNSLLVILRAIYNQAVNNNELQHIVIEDELFELCKQELLISIMPTSSNISRELFRFHLDLLIQLQLITRHKGFRVNEDQSREIFLTQNLSLTLNGFIFVLNNQDTFVLPIQPKVDALFGTVL